MYILRARFRCIGLDLVRYLVFMNLMTILFHCVNFTKMNALFFKTCMTNSSFTCKDNYDQISIGHWLYGTANVSRPRANFITDVYSRLFDKLITLIWRILQIKCLSHFTRMTHCVVTPKL